MAETAANSLQLSPNKALELKVIDSVIKEPAGGAHRYPDQAIAKVKECILTSLNQLMAMDTDLMMQKRFEKFRQMGNSTITVDSEDAKE
jgi:acetyl-CoA carboxylase carboxyl transferase subunit alpha